MTTAAVEGIEAPDVGARPTWHRVLPHLLLILGWLATLPLTGHYGNPDGAAYTSVAERWLAGDLPAAVNAYWGPLLSWGAAPLLAVGVPGLLALRIVLLVGALAALPAVRTSCLRAGATDRATTWMLLATVPLLLYMVTFGLYADVLMASALLWMLAVTAGPTFTRRLRTAVLAGALGGVAYLARAYAVPVVLVSLPLVSALTVWCGRPPARPAAAARALGGALLGFLLVAGTWATVLSVTYDEPTFSSSAGFNADLVAPGSAGNPFNVPALHEPVLDDAVSAWEEPSELPVPLRDDAGDGLGTPDVSQRADLAVANARIAVGSVLRRGAPVAGLALVALVAAVVWRRRPAVATLAPLLTGAVAAGGLLLIIAIERYLWFPILAMVPAAAVGLDVVTARRPRLLPVVGGVVVAWMVVSSIHGMLPRVGAHQEVTAAARALDEGQLDGRVATAESWQRAHQLCFLGGCQYLGRPVATDADAAARELRDAGVDHLVVWDGDEDAIDGLAFPDRSAELTVFDVEDAGLRATWVVDGDRAEPVTG